MCGILIISLDLASVAPSDWTLGQKLILALAYLAFVGVLPIFINMSQASSSNRPTPLQCLLNHFKDFRRRAQVYGACVTPFDLQRFCQLDWPTFGTGWPPEGSLDLQTAFQVRNIICGNSGHPDQAPYIDVWIDIVSDAPKYLKDCRSGKESKTTPKSVLFSTPKEPKEKPSRQRSNPLDPVLQAPPEDPEITDPPPYAPYDPVLSPSNREAKPLLSPPHTCIGVVYQSPQYSVTVPDLSNWTAVLAPLWPLAPLVGRETQRPFMVYVPFSTSDLYNWKHQNPSFSEKPQGLTSLLETIFFTYQPTWDGCQQLLHLGTPTLTKVRRLSNSIASFCSRASGLPADDPLTYLR
uniref:Uncharacterized protein n=1 Tax=Rousettus aegyptiacus TaxID=9407 RepID=A0A7J8GAI2_ROUAE|nr:hypothetical protein HJG63_011604 [Rousettus aegyptiacus]